MSKNIAILFTIFSIGLVGCNNIHGLSKEEKITRTTQKVLTYIADSNYSDFKKLLNRSYQKSMDVEGLTHYFNITHECLNRHIDVDTCKIIFTDEPKFDSTVKIIVPLFNGFDSTNGLLSLNVILYYGPEEFVPLSKVTHFFVEDKYDVSYRKGLFETGKLKGLLRRDSTSQPTFEDIFGND